MSGPAGDDLHRAHIVLESVLIEVRGLAAAVCCIGSVLELEADVAVAPDKALQALGGRIVELARKGQEAIEAAMRVRRKERGIKLPCDDPHQLAEEALAAAGKSVVNPKLVG